ncbi:MAG: hypothetical protein JWR54_2046 [Mucilaginibacter sp.]|nr:hypothetical protein [Mucilaginibacter sp.]
MKKLDIPEYYPHYYTATDHPERIDVENANFISILGKGSFMEEIFYQRIALLKQATQAVIDLFQDSGKGFELSVLEGLYWNDEKYGQHSISHVFDTGPLSELNYRLMIRLPEYVTLRHIAAAKDTLDPIHKDLSKGIAFFEYQEGNCIQMLHKGPFIYEFETLGKLEQFAEENTLSKRGIHHEIYLVDFTTGGSQENLKTILREPVGQ